MKYARKKIVILSISTLSILTALASFLFFWQIPLSVQHQEAQYLYRTIARIHAARYEQDEDGWEWRNSRILMDNDKLEHGESIELVIIVDSFFPQNTHETGRTLYRDGGQVHVIYVSITESLITALHHEYLALTTGGIRTQPRPFISDALKNIEQFPKKIEIYYLQNLHRQRRRIQRMSDEQFDQLRESATQVWSGVIGVAE